MKTENEIRGRIEQLDERLDHHIKRSPEWNRVVGKKQALEWVIGDE